MVTRINQIVCVKIKFVEIGGIYWLNPNSDVNNVIFQKKKWLRGFELYVLGKGITRADQKKTLL